MRDRPQRMPLWLRKLERIWLYSHRNAWMGSTRLARIAGTDIRVHRNRQQDCRDHDKHQRVPRLHGEQKSRDQAG